MAIRQERSTTTIYEKQKVKKRIEFPKLHTIDRVIVIKAEKRNVFLSLTSIKGKVFVVFTPGLILKSTVTRADYKLVDERRQRRRKRHMRAYINNAKRSKFAIRHTCSEFIRRLSDKKLVTIGTNFYCCVHLTGSNTRLGRNILKLFQKLS